MVLEEGWANVVAAPIRTVVILIASAVMAFAVVSFTIRDVAGIAARFGDQVAAGRFVLVASAADPAGLDVVRCDALNSVPGVHSAGAVVSSRQVFPAAAPGRPYEVLSVTEGLVRAWFPGPASVRPGTGWVSGAGVARELGLAEGTWVAVSDEAHLGPAPPRPSFRIGGVLPGSLRKPEGDRKLYEVVAPGGRAPACVVDVAPAAFESIDQVVSAWFPVDQRVGVTAFSEGLGAGRSPEAELRERPSAGGWIAGAGVLAVISALSWHGRRDEFALYRLLGASHAVVAGLLAVEAALVIALPVLVGIAAAVVVQADALAAMQVPELVGSSAGRLVGLDAAALLLALVPSPLVGLAAVSRRSPFDHLKGL